MRFAESAGLSQQPNIFGFASQRFMRGFPFLPNVVFLVSWSFGLQSAPAAFFDLADLINCFFLNLLSPRLSSQFPAMAAPRLFRPASRLLSSRLSTPLRPAFAQSALRSRSYATEGGVKEVTVRDALNEALAEELELNQKTFILGEEVAQYNGA